jgi:hypothetical protein
MLQVGATGIEEIEKKERKRQSANLNCDERCCPL